MVFRRRAGCVENASVHLDVGFRNVNTSPKAGIEKPEGFSNMNQTGFTRCSGSNHRYYSDGFF